MVMQLQEHLYLEPFLEHLLFFLEFHLFNPPPSTQAAKVHLLVLDSFVLSLPHMSGVCVRASTGGSLGTPLPDPAAAAASAATTSESHPVAAKALSKSYSKVKGGIRLKAGEWFGEIALLNDGKRTANVLADSSVRLLVFDRDSFEQVREGVCS